MQKQGAVSNLKSYTPTTSGQIAVGNYYTEIRSNQVFGGVSLVAGPFSTVADRDRFNQRLLRSLPTINRELETELGPNRIALAFDDLESLVKPEGVRGVSVTFWKEIIKTDFRSRNPDPEFLKNYNT